MSIVSESPSVPAAAEPADAAVHFEVAQLYCREAELLDEGRFADWLELFADDLVYWMPTRTNRLRRQQALSVAAPGEATSCCAALTAHFRINADGGIGVRGFASAAGGDHL